MDSIPEWYTRIMFNDGYLLPELQLEMPLYRYRSNLHYASEEIKTGNIFLAPLDSLNDPFDSSYALSYEEALEDKKPADYYYACCYFFQDKPWYQNVKGQISERAKEAVTLREFGNLLSSIIQETGDVYPASAICKNYYKYALRDYPKRQLGRVACFSETWDSIPMWAYYANAHKGVCFKYDFSMLDNKDPTFEHTIKSIRKVWYSNTRPEDKHGLYSQFIKGLPWAHEQEWRLFRQFGGEFAYLPCVTEVYLGAQICVHDKEFDELIDAIKNASHKITPFFLFPEPDKYSFRKVPLLL